MFYPTVSLFSSHYEIRNLTEQWGMSLQELFAGLTPSHTHIYKQMYHGKIPTTKEFIDHWNDRMYQLQRKRKLAANPNTFTI